MSRIIYDHHSDEWIDLDKETPRSSEDNSELATASLIILIVIILIQIFK